MSEAQIFENTNSDIPPADFTITELVAKQILAEQYPALSHLPITALGSGWDNVVYKIGESHTLRMPRHQTGNELLQNEQKWLGVLGANLSLPIPAPIHIGKPSPDFPFVWSINPYFDGAALGDTVLADSQSAIFAQFLTQLQNIDPKGAPINPVRGGRLLYRAEVMMSRMKNVALRSGDLMARALPLWEKALTAPIGTNDVWLHGDLHNFNIVAKNNSITAIIDWGDMCAGDAATDLSAVFAIFESPHVQNQIFQILGASEATIIRSKGWALMMGILFMDWGKNNQSDRFRIGENIVNRVLTF